MRKTYLDRMEDEKDRRYEERHKEESMSLVKEEEFNYSGFNFHEVQENIVDILVKKTGQDDRGYFRILVAYKLAEIASHMRTNVEYLGDELPVNMYSVCLAKSGFSKGLSMNILDSKIFNEFRNNFEKITLPKITELNLQILADEKALFESIDLSKAEDKIHKEFNMLPKFLYSFGSSTIEGYKALRKKLSLSGIGATSLIIDEIGSNLSANSEVLATHLDSYDVGRTKQKLIKTDSNSEIYGSVPSNLFMFGTQSKLFDGGSIEETFFDLLEEGFGRRLLFGYVEKAKSQSKKLTPEEIYEAQMDTSTDMDIIRLSNEFKNLAHESYLNQTVKVSKEVAMLFIKYRSDCRDLADTLKNHEEVKEAIVSHGYWRAIKIAGAYAFIDKTREITMEQAKAAIALVEQSNKSFDEIARRPASYVKLIEYMADVNNEITQVELVENLPFYRGSESQKREMMTLALAYGYRNKIVVKRTYSDGVEFFKADRLNEVDLNSLKVSWSKEITYNYQEAKVKWEDLPKLVCNSSFHYTVHSWENGHRNTDNLIQGFDLCVIDVDNGVSIKAAKSLLAEYQYLIYETKRSTKENNRFRIIIPLSHRLYLDAKNYKEFMKNVFDFLPFDVDDQTSDIARKWLGNTSEPIINEGQKLDVYDFLPNTKKQEEMKVQSDKIKDADATQKYFLLRSDDDGRNNSCLKYAFMLMDDGHNADDAIIHVRDFNKKLKHPLTEKELNSTVIRSIYRKEAQLGVEK